MARKKKKIRRPEKTPLNQKTSHGKNLQNRRLSRIIKLYA